MYTSIDFLVSRDAAERENLRAMFVSCLRHLSASFALTTITTPPTVSALRLPLFAAPPLPTLRCPAVPPAVVVVMMVSTSSLHSSCVATRLRRHFVPMPPPINSSSAAAELFFLRRCFEFLYE